METPNGASMGTCRDAGLQFAWPEQHKPHFPLAAEISNASFISFLPASSGSAKSTNAALTGAT